MKHAFDSQIFFSYKVLVLQSDLHRLPNVCGSGTQNTNASDGSECGSKTRKECKLPQLHYTSCTTVLVVINSMSGSIQSVNTDL